MARERLDPGSAKSERVKEILTMHGDSIARDYRIFELDLSTARNNEEIPVKGNFFGLLYISAIGTPVRIRPDSEDAESIPLYSPAGVTLAFDKLWLSHAAAAGVTAVLMVGWDLR